MTQIRKPRITTRRGVLLDSHLCPLCNAAMEDVQYVFFRCVVARVVLRKICRWWELDWQEICSFSDWDACSGLHLFQGSDVVATGGFNRIMGTNDREGPLGVFYVLQHIHMGRREVLTVLGMVLVLAGGNLETVVIGLGLQEILSSDRGNHSICPVIGKGNIQVKMHDNVVRTITGVRHVPDLKRNLISLSTLEANGCKYSGDGGVRKIFKGALVLMKAIQSCGLYVLQCTVVYGSAGVATSKASLDDFKLWHYHLGHMGEKGMKNLAKKDLIKVSCNLEFCEHCVFGKQKRVSFSPGIQRMRDALDYIHSDLWGPSPVTSRGASESNSMRTQRPPRRMIQGDFFENRSKRTFVITWMNSRRSTSLNDSRMIVINLIPRSFLSLEDEPSLHASGNFPST
ncbi:retrovirus-related pol polyprotein from transposon TNT 1-94 [Tanacetum coccineum]